jgi:Rps23 Pro-64 3,4-dihydroxylase Tpa1-like proline 4-hydroxylase
MKTLADYIVPVDNVLPDNVADQILAEYKESNDWVTATTFGLTDDRQCSTIGISYESVMSKNLEIRKKIDDLLFESAADALKQYKSIAPPISKDTYFAEKDTGYELLRYNTGDFYKEHTDAANIGNYPHRILSCSFVLNDDYEGGEFAFFNRELVYKPKKGACIMFPSSFMFPHEVMPVTSGTRYSIITWFV